MLSDLFKALSDPIRRKILNLLKEKPLSAGEISSSFELTDATISHHLSVLKSAGLVDSKKKGTFIVYQLETSLFEEAVNWIIGLKSEDFRH